KLSVGLGGRRPGQAVCQRLEYSLLARGELFLLQALQGVSQNRACPASIECSIRGFRDDGLRGITNFPSQFFQREKTLASAPLPRLRPCPFACQQVFHRVQQERSKPRPGRFELGQQVPLKQPLKKALGQVLSILGRIAPAPDERVKGVPVRTAQLLQRRLRGR